jgi:hypothetical protein
MEKPKSSSTEAAAVATSTTSSVSTTTSTTNNTNNLPSFAPAIAASFLLRDFENYGLSERVRYHFHLSEVSSTSMERNTEGWDRLPKEAQRCGCFLLLLRIGCY